MRHGVITGIAALNLALLTGCRVHHDGYGKDVKLDTPFGGMSVKTDTADVQAQLGLPVYPGAVPEKKSGDDHGSADVNLNFGSFHLGVKAASYTSPDTPAKVMSFYRGQLGTYGAVIECRGKQTVGTPAATDGGLHCDEGSHGSVRGDDGELQLKAGSRQHQHVVGITPEGDGTKFSLVMLDLPHPSDSEDRQ